ncbi:MAG TPA: hypothetical protein VGH42_12575 [Verrucomicrobiae bacterium]|jgi:hypothetical protein
MNWLPKDKEKRKQLVLALLSTVVLLVVILLGLIRPQYEAISKTNVKIAAARAKLQSVEDTIKKADTLSLELADANLTLSHFEADMASGDVYSWTYDTIRSFKADYKVEIPTIGQPAMSDVDLLPRFPYKQLKVTVNGTAYYHDLGKFIADFENKFPHIRVVNLTLEPASDAGANNEKLAFSMDIIALIKPNAS